VNEENVMSVASAAMAVSIVLVHGGFVDGSGWPGVYNILKKDGYSVRIVQNPSISLGDDVAVTKRVIAAQAGPVILVGHSYGGAVIMEAGNDPKALVYIAAFAPDRGQPRDLPQGLSLFKLPHQARNDRRPARRPDRASPDRSTFLC
jgi:pimeloyl-ACP methyl ester carboxylesterase